MPEKDFAHEKLFHKNNSGMEEIQICYIGCATEFIPAGLIPTQPTLVTRQYAYEANYIQIGTYICRCVHENRKNQL